MRKRLAILILALLAGVGCTTNTSRWLESKDFVESVVRSEIPGRKLGERTQWGVVATVKPTTSLAEIQSLVDGWPRRADSRGSQLTVIRRTGAVEHSFTAYDSEAVNGQRWKSFTTLIETWPDAAIAMFSSAAAGADLAPGDRSRIRVTLEDCSPWEEVSRLDVARIVATPMTTGLSVACRAPVDTRLVLTARSVSETTDLATIRDRAESVLAPFPPGTPWVVEADGDTQPLRVEVTTPEILDRPTQAELEIQQASLTIDTGRAIVAVTRYADPRAAVRAALVLPWAARIEAAAGTRAVMVRGDIAHLGELVPIATNHPLLTWYHQDPNRPHWVRAPGAEFGERAEQYARVAAQPIDWGEVIVLRDRHIAEIHVTAPAGSDWQAVARAVRAADWSGTMRVVIGSGYPGVEFLSTASGPARDVAVANSHRPPTRDRHPELIDIVQAWDATAG